MAVDAVEQLPIKQVLDLQSAETQIKKTLRELAAAKP
jgi:hypothetical protein